MTVAQVIDAFTTKDEDGNITNFNFADFDQLVSDLVTERAKIRKENKEAIKEEKKAKEASAAEVGEAFYKSLKVGDKFSFTTADGTKWDGVKIETKSKTGTTAAIELSNPPAGAKTAKRYPKFHQVSVPQEFIDAYNAEKEELAKAKEESVA